MPTISSCPFCQAQVAVPVGAAPADEVRCPLCQAQFSLGETLDISLPELIVVRSAGINPPPALVAAAVAPNGDAWNSGSSYGMPVYRPSDSGGYDMSGGGVELESADDAAFAAAPAPAADGLLGEQGEANLGSAWGSPEVPEASYPSGGMGIDTGVEALDPTEAGIVAKPRKKRKDPNMAIEMLKAVVGGAMGLFIAYMILMWSISWDPLKFAQKMPSWMVPDKLESR